MSRQDILSKLRRGCGPDWYSNEAVCCRFVDPNAKTSPTLLVGLQDVPQGCEYPSPVNPCGVSTLTLVACSFVCLEDRLLFHCLRDELAQCRPPIRCRIRFRVGLSVAASC